MDLEGIIDLIIIIAVFGISIASSLKKNKKQKQQSAESQTESNDDPWESIKRYFDEADDVKEGEELQEEIVQAASPEPQTTSSLYDDYSGFNAAKQYNSQISASKDTRVKTQKQVTISTTQEESDSDVLLENFNLRDAVLYSEIMKPKFEE